MSAAEATNKPKKGARKLILLVLVPLLLALGGAGAAVSLGVVSPPFSGAAEVLPSGAEPGREESDPTDVVFVEVPELLVNLNVTGTRLRFLKFAAALEVRNQKDAERVVRLLPRIADNFHAYVRALQIEEFGGPDAVYRVKRDLLARANQVLRPVEVRDVLIREMLVQ